MHHTAAPFPRSEWSAGQPVCKLTSERTRPDLPFCQPCGSTPTAAGPCSQGIRFCLRRTPGDTSVTLTAPLAEPEPAQSLHQPRSFPSQWFHVLFDALFNLSFPHSTCSLSVSCKYLALGGVYHPFWAAILNNPIFRHRSYLPWFPPHMGLLPSLACISRTTLGTLRRVKLALQTTIC